MCFRHSGSEIKMTGLNGSIFSSDHQAVVLEFHCHPAEEMTTENRSGISEVS